MALAPSRQLAASLPPTPLPPFTVLHTPRLSVVIVNYYQWSNTASLVRQLRLSRVMREQGGEVLIVDNHSPFHPLARRLRRCPGVALRRWGRNRGFARAVNEGSRLSQGEWLLLLNPDMSLPAGFLDRVRTVADHLDEHEPRVGIVGFGLRNSDGSRQSSAGAFPTLLNTLTGLLRPRAHRKYHLQVPEKRCAVDWVTGCCMLIRRECWQQVGGLDRDFFLYYEDVDLCRRARDEGWSVWYEPALEAVHHNPLQNRSVSPALRLVTRHSLLMYGWKHWPRWQFQLLAQLVRAEAWLRGRGSRRRGDKAASRLFQQMGQLAQDMARGRRAAVQRVLTQLTRTHRFAADDNPPALLPVEPPR